MIIAIDGPAGAGKSTVSKLLAKRLGFVYLDTGAMYRALAWAFAKSGREAPSGEEALCGMLAQMELRFAIENERLEISCGGKILSEELRSPEISEAASKISRLPTVREFLVDRQRRLALQGTGIVTEGRDTATVVFPNAELKVFLTADIRTRAKRRLAEYLEKGQTMSLEQTERLIGERDEADSRRDHSPLRPAQDSVYLDTSGLAIEEVVERLGEMVEKLGSGKKRAEAGSRKREA